MVVLVLPLGQQPPQLLGVRKGELPVELFLIGPVAALDFLATLRAARGNVPQVKSVPNSEPWSVLMRWITIGRRCRTSSMNAIADLIELWS